MRLQSQYSHGLLEASDTDLSVVELSRQYLNLPHLVHLAKLKELHASPPLS